MQIAALPGRKLLLRGNHDYWWNSISKVRALLPENMYAIQNDALSLDGVVYCGTRGWNIPGEGQPADPQDVKIFQRELLRLEMSLQQAEKLAHGSLPVVVMMHYPPLYKDLLSTPFTEILERYGRAYRGIRPPARRGHPVWIGRAGSRNRVPSGQLRCASFFPAPDR